jgi:putative ABC transport system ATP-binding protein
MTTNPRKQQLAKQLLQASDNDIQQAIATLQALKKPGTAKAYKPRSSEVIAHVTGVSKKYKVGRSHVQALNNVSIDIYKGEFVALTGPSGSGKSTLLQLIGGLDKPAEGTIEIAGQDLAKLRDRQLSKFRNQTIGFVFQFFYLQPFLDLQTNIEVPAMFSRTKRPARRGRSEELAATVGLSERLHHLPKELSGGQMQRAAIARALQNSPSILLADEPTGNLDRKNALAIFDLFRTICDKQGTTVVVVTHDLGLAATADRVVELQDGAII